jgi:hypothetical protein
MLFIGGILSLGSVLFMFTAALAPTASSKQTIEYSRPAGSPLYGRLDSLRRGTVRGVILVHG